MDILWIVIAIFFLIIFLQILGVLMYFKKIIQHLLIENPALFHWRKLSQYCMRMEVRHIQPSPFFGPTAIHLQSTLMRKSFLPAIDIVFVRVRTTDIVVYTRRENVPTVNTGEPKMVWLEIVEYQNGNKTLLWMKDWCYSKEQYQIVDEHTKSWERKN